MTKFYTDGIEKRGNDLLVMVKKIQEDIKKAQNAFDGNMPECLRSVCEKSCCRVKNTITDNNIGKNNKPVITTFNCSLVLGERPLIDLNGSSVEFVKLPELDNKHVHLVTNCFTNEGICKMSSNKPIQCRLYPFKIEDIENPLETECPAHKEIAKNSKTRNGIKLIMKSFGYNNDYITKWEKHLLKKIKSNT